MPPRQACRTKPNLLVPYLKGEINSKWACRGAGQPSRFQARQKERDPQTGSLWYGERLDDAQAAQFEKTMQASLRSDGCRMVFTKKPGNSVDFVVIQKVTKNYRLRESLKEKHCKAVWGWGEICLEIHFHLSDRIHLSFLCLKNIFF